MAKDARTRLVFNWAEVDPNLRARLVADAYRSRSAVGTAGVQAEFARTARLATSPSAARNVLGGLPIGPWALIMEPALRNVWIPGLSSEDVTAVVNALRPAAIWGRSRYPNTKTASLEWLRHQPTGDPTFAKQLLTVFKARHKAPRVVQRSRRAPTAAEIPSASELRGSGKSSEFTKHEHQGQAWSRLDELAAMSVLAGARKRKRHSGGLIVIPTGGGKTYTAVHWLMRLTVQYPDIRVLWLADQVELVEQAVEQFKRLALRMPTGMTRNMHVIHGTASPTALADPNVHIVCATRQSLTYGDMANSQPALRRFLRKPVVVVVDEVHHAASPTYLKLLDYITSHAPASLLVGLSATPWPQAPGAIKKLHQRFPEVIAQADTLDLIQREILARPVVHSVTTGLQITLDKDDYSDAVRINDLTDEILQQVNNAHRNQLIVSLWKAHQSRWGKTLVFACNKKHADALYGAFHSAGVLVDVVHSDTDKRVGEVLEWFKNQHRPVVLVSVNMLREGVDMPDAVTAFLARPTKSPIVLRQMVGRVLRGKLAGGKEIAHLVDLRDKWQEGIDVLSPYELAGLEATAAEDTPEGLKPLPPLVEESTGTVLPWDVEAAVRRALAELQSVPEYAGLISTELLGYYALADRNVPVFSHTKAGWDALIERVQSTYRPTPIEVFDDLPIPRPSRAEADAVAAWVVSAHASPRFVPVTMEVSPWRIAEELLSQQDAMRESERRTWLRGKYETGLARSCYATFDAFRTAVDQAVDHLEGQASRRLDAENPRSIPVQRLKPLPKSPRRDINGLLQGAMRRGEELLADEPDAYWIRLTSEPTPQAEWTRNDINWALAYWTPRIGRTDWRPLIRVNKSLKAPMAIVTDDMLEYLLWHELCHHILPGNGHDSEFRRLEHKWPEAPDRDFELDELCRHYHVGTRTH